MSIDVEYAIKKDIRNNPVVREVDHGQKREFLRTLWLAVVVVGTLLFAVWQHYEVVQYGYDIEKVRKDLVREETVSRQLRVEYERVHAPQYLESRATQELHMAPPSSNDTLVLDKVLATTAGKGIVAAVR
jgi:cell division protein FtsL